MDDNEMSELNRKYVQAALDECRLLHRREHIDSTMEALQVRYAPRLFSDVGDYLVLNADGLECGFVTVHALGDTTYSIDAIEQCVKANKKAMLDLHQQLMAVHDGGEGEGGPENEFTHKPATPVSERLGTSDPVELETPDDAGTFDIQPSAHEHSRPSPKGKTPTPDPSLQPPPSPLHDSQPKQHQIEAEAQQKQHQIEAEAQQKQHQIEAEAQQKQRRKTRPIRKLNTWNQDPGKEPGDDGPSL